MKTRFLRNVGNLVCPAEFDTGAVKNVMILSVPEGDDKPLKYPLIFKESEVVLLNKIDLLPYVPFDKEKALVDIHNLNPTVNVFEVSCTDKTGLFEWTQWIRTKLENR